MPFLVGELAEPTPVVVLHTMAEPFIDKVVDIYHNADDPPEVRHDNSRHSQDQDSETVDKEKGHVLVAESAEGKSQQQVFQGSGQVPRACITSTAQCSPVRFDNLSMPRTVRRSGLTFPGGCTTGHRTHSRGDGIMTIGKERARRRPLWDRSGWRRRAYAVRPR